jgi:hypothetical protein
MLRANRIGSPGRNARALALAAAMLVLGAASTRADTIIFSGQISQSTSDSGATAFNNPDLNAIQDLDLFSVTLIFPGSISAAGSHNPLPGATLLFQDLTNPASENSFDPVNISAARNG